MFLCIFVLRRLAITSFRKLVITLFFNTSDLDLDFSSNLFSYDQDMVAFSCCVFDGGAQEDRDMKAARERGWRGKFTKPGRTILPGAIRLNGKCPLSPLEVYLALSYC